MSGIDRSRASSPIFHPVSRDNSENSFDYERAQLCSSIAREAIAETVIARATTPERRPEYLIGNELPPTPAPSPEPPCTMDDNESFEATRLIGPGILFNHRDYEDRVEECCREIKRVVHQPHQVKHVELLKLVALPKYHHIIRLNRCINSIWSLAFNNSSTPVDLWTGSYINKMLREAPNAKLEVCKFFKPTNGEWE